MDLQREQEELLGRDTRPAPRAQEVHQIALTEEKKHVRTNGRGLPGDFAFRGGCSAWLPSNPWGILSPSLSGHGSALTLLMNSMTM